MALIPSNPFTTLQYLVIDDFAEMRSMITSIIQNYGVHYSQIDTASNAQKAMEWLGKKTYDVILADYNLGPGKDGQQLLEEARHTGLLGLHTIFVMVTAENTRMMVMGAAEYAPDTYLSKPLSKDLLRTRLLNLIERKKELQQVNDALARNDNVLALELLDKLIAERPKHLTDLMKIKGEISLNAGRIDDALLIYNHALDNRELTWALLGKGRALHAKKEYPAAASCFSRVIELEPNIMAAYDWLAKTQKIMGQPEAAEVTLAQASELSPKAVRRQQELGALAMENGNTQLAEKAFNKAIQVGRHSAFNHPTAYAGLAKAMTANNNLKEAKKIVSNITKTFKDNPEASFYQATAQAFIMHREGNTQGAEEEMARAEKLITDIDHASTGPMGLELAKMLILLEKKEKASKLLTSIVANNHDDDELLSTMGKLFTDTGLSETPETTIEEIRKGVFNKNNQGVRMIRSGDIDKAVELLQDAADELSSNKTINLNAAQALIMKLEAQGNNAQDFERASRYINRIKQMAPDDWRLAGLIPRLQQVS
jgi:tetratricopeptide (TPR) repeat protein